MNKIYQTLNNLKIWYYNRLNIFNNYVNTLLMKFANFLLKIILIIYLIKFLGSTI